MAKHTLLQGVSRPAIYILLGGGIPRRGGGAQREESRAVRRWCGKLADVMIGISAEAACDQREGSGSLWSSLSCHSEMKKLVHQLTKVGVSIHYYFYLKLMACSMTPNECQ